MGAGRPPGTGWKPQVRELREAAVEKMRSIVGSDTDPLLYVCELAADPEQDVQLRLSAASIALPYLYPRLSATQVSAQHTVVKVDAADLVERLSQKFARLAPAPREIETVAAVPNAEAA